MPDFSWCEGHTFTPSKAVNGVAVMSTVSSLDTILGLI